MPLQPDKPRVPRTHILSEHCYPGGSLGFVIEILAALILLTAFLFIV